MQSIKYAFILSTKDKWRFILVLMANVLAFLIIFSTFFFVQTMIKLGDNMVKNIGGDYWVLPVGYVSYLTAPPIKTISLEPLKNNPNILSLYEIQEIQLPTYKSDTPANRIEMRTDQVYAIKAPESPTVHKSDNLKRIGLFDLNTKEVIINSITKKYLNCVVGDQIVIQDHDYKVVKIIVDSSEQPRAYLKVTSDTDFTRRESSSIFGVININPQYKDQVTARSMNDGLPKDTSIQIVPTQLVSFKLISSILTKTTDRIIMILIVIALIISIGTTTISMFTNTLNLKQHYLHMNYIGVSNRSILSFIWLQGIIYLVPAVLFAVIISIPMSVLLFSRVITPSPSIIPEVKGYTLILIGITIGVAFILSFISTLLPYQLLVVKQSFSKGKN